MCIVYIKASNYKKGYCSNQFDIWVQNKNLAFAVCKLRNNYQEIGITSRNLKKEINKQNQNPSISRYTSNIQR